MPAIPPSTRAPDTSAAAPAAGLPLWAWVPLMLLVAALLVLLGRALGPA